MHPRSLLPVICIVAAVAAVVFYSPPPVSAQSLSLRSSSFSVALETLQKHINYDFQNIGLLRRAMTHSSYSEENNKAFSILGEDIIETTVSLRLLAKDVDISSKDLTDRVSEISKVETSCAVDGMRLGLQNVVRVSSNTNSSTSSVVCGAFRAIFGAIALDTGKSDDAGNVFLVVHGGAGVLCTSKSVHFGRRTWTRLCLK
ncbi:Ribonuclease III [Cynara cardunculus var. scolymus]|uniref:Ribonuclease III n=1 Tax=Cynara cardunculus var. scolymus TaxID=59895 RepID=A0A124SDW0_CYNCS|nr:Ribonuclease III [Cynara cardunculus var. scolymus]